MIKLIGVLIGIFFLLGLLDIIMNSGSDGARASGVVVLMLIIAIISTRNWD